MAGAGGEGLGGKGVDQHPLISIIIKMKKAIKIIEMTFNLLKFEY
jgi:hypothetical protein